MGRRRRRVIKIVKRKIPKVFLCPLCGEESVRITVKNPGLAEVQCGNKDCELNKNKEEFEMKPSEQMVDIYCKFIDKHSH
ncbi:MAG: hypothetical protein QXW19_05340 [Candidatus Bathyarchaeia archaeon]